jgi:hypothetical protein
LKDKFFFKVDPDKTPMETALDGLNQMLGYYIADLVFRARRNLLSIIRDHNPDVLSAVDIGFDPNFSFSIDVVHDDSTVESIHRVAHELLYGTLCERGEWTGHWMKYRRGYAQALNNWNKIQQFVYNKFGFYLSDVSTDKGAVTIMLANRFGQFQLIRANRGYRFWHKHVFLPTDVYETLTVSWADLPDFVDVPFDWDYDPELDFEDVYKFVSGMMGAQGL